LKYLATVNGIPVAVASSSPVMAAKVAKLRKRFEKAETVKGLFRGQAWTERFPGDPPLGTILVWEMDGERVVDVVGY
jgi:hypothetical protein